MLANSSLLFRQLTSLTAEDFPEAMEMSGVESSGRALCHLLFSWATERLLASCTPAFKL